jgi:phosphoribosylformylglycinamidine synthase
LDPADPCQGLGGSAYLLRCHRKKLGTPPPCDLAREKLLHDTLRELIAHGWIRSAHDCSEGGLAVCLAECCFSRREARGHSILLGAEVDFTPWKDARQDALWFGEAHGRVVISTTPQHAERVEACANNRGVPVHRLGTVKGQTLKIKSASGTHSARLSTLHDLWWNAIDRAMSK